MDQEQQTNEEQGAQDAIESSSGSQDTQGQDSQGADSGAEAAAPAADDGQSTSDDAAAQAGDVMKDMYDDQKEKQAADDGGAPAQEDQAKANDEAQGDKGKSLVAKAKDMALKGGSRKAVTAVVEKAASRAGLSALGKVAGPIGGALVDGAMAAKDNIQAYKDGRISATRAVTNTLAEGAIGAASGLLGPVGGAAARFALGKFARLTGIIKDPEKKAA